MSRKNKISKSQHGDDVTDVMN